MRGRKSARTALMRSLLEQGYKPKDIVTEVIKQFPEVKVNIARVQISLIKKLNRNKEQKLCKIEVPILEKEDNISIKTDINIVNNTIQPLNIE